MKKYGRGKLREAVLEALTTPRKSIDGRYVVASAAKAAARRVQIAAGKAALESASEPLEVHAARVREAENKVLSTSGAAYLARATVRDAKTKDEVVGALRTWLEALDVERRGVLATLNLLGVDP